MTYNQCLKKYYSHVQHICTTNSNEKKKQKKQETVITGNNSSQRFFFSWARVLHHKISTPVPASHVIIFAGPAHVMLATDLR